MTDTTVAPAAPKMASPPDGADGIAEVREVAPIADRVQTYSPSALSWLDGLNGFDWWGWPGCEFIPVWWRWRPDPDPEPDPLGDAAFWIESICQAADKDGGRLGLDPSVIGGGIELAAALRARQDDQP